MAFFEVPIASALFLLLFATSAVEYMRRRSIVTGAVVLIFGSVSAVFAGRLLAIAGLALPEPVERVASIGVLAQPVVTLWLASLVERVPRWVMGIALVGTTVAAVWLLVSGDVLPQALIVGAVAVYVFGALAATYFFLRAASRRIGSARLRLIVAAAATLLMAGTLLVVAAGRVAPGSGDLTSAAGRFTLLLAALGYALAFLAPQRLRRWWSAQTAYGLSRRLLGSSAESDASGTWRCYVELVAGAAGVRHASVIAGQPDGTGQLVAALGEHESEIGRWSEADFAQLLRDAESTHQRPCRGFGPDREAGASGALRYLTLIPFSLPHGRRAVLALAGETRSIFSSDDHEAFETLGTEAGFLADRAATTAEQIALADRLAATVKALKTAHQAKSDFLASMSHELRTPLNAILGFSDLMRTEPVADGRRNVPEEWIEHVHVAGRHLLGLINDVLDLAKIEAGRLDLRPEEVAVDSAVAEAVAGLRPLLEKKSLQVNTEVELTRLVVDRGRLRQILYNLISNAIKYTPAGGRLSIEARQEDGEARLSVADTGAGIAPEDHQRIFDEFTQVGDPEARQAGTGLGLALTRRLVEAHGGRIELHSALGEGSRFTVVLPMAQAAPQPARQSTPVPVPVGPAAPKAAAGGQPHVLVVEDDPQALVLLRSYLEQSGYDVIAARDGSAALELARARHPSAILLDVLLPDIDGWEVLRRLKADDELRGMPVLIITVVDEREVGLALGAVDYLVKPIEREALLAALARHVPRLTNGHRRPRVLAIDDDETARSLVRAVLEDQGCEVTLTDHGRGAIEAVERQEFDLIICDLVMPDMDGFEVVARLKQTPAARDVPILILTGHALSEPDKQRLNGKVVGTAYKGEDSVGRLREWLAHVVNGGLQPGHG